MERVGAQWTQVARVLEPFAANSNSSFGYAVAMDGTRALVSSRNSVAFPSYSGLVYVFDLVGGTWAHTATLTPQQGAADGFGGSVALDGDRALVGAPLSHAAFIFERVGTNWIQNTRLTVVDADNLNFFGHSVSLDGNRALVGAPSHGLNNEGAGFVFDYHAPSNLRSKTATLEATAPSASNRLGSSVAVEGGLAVLGAGVDGTTPGAAYVYRAAAGAWNQQARLVEPGGVNGNAFGWVVAIGNGRVVVSAPFSGAGAVYVFARQGVAWSRTQTLTARGSDHFGHGLAVDGDRMTVGAPRTAGQRGRVYHYAVNAVLGPGGGTGGGASANLMASDTPAPGVSITGANPAASRTALTVTTTDAEEVRVVVYDVQGREVAVPFDGTVAGPVRVDLDLSDLAAGVYVVQVQAETFVEARRLTVVR